MTIEHAALENLSPEERKKYDGMVAGEKEFLRTKIITEKTAMPYLFKIVANRLRKLNQKAKKDLSEEDQIKADAPTLSTAVTMFQEDRDRFKEILEDAGYTVETLPVEL